MPHRALPEPPITRRERSLGDPIVLRAIANVDENVAAMPASDVVQLALWPQSLAAWAREQGEDESQLSNLFRRYRTYARLREELARRLSVEPPVLAQLIEARVALPRPYRPSAAIVDASTTAHRASRDADPWPAAPPFPPVRTGANPIERAATARLRLDAPALPASRIIALAIWPDTLTAWAARTPGCSPGQVLTALSGLRRAPRAEAALARRLDVSVRALDEFINSVKAESRITRPPTPDDMNVDDTSSARTRGGTPMPATPPSPDDQLGLGF